jgi:glycosyltransferase involved in cell wall biosynthesis
MRIAHFIHRFPPALGGSEAYFARLGNYLQQQGDDVTVFTTTALDLSAFWSPRGQCLPSGEFWQDGARVRRYPLWRFFGRRYLLKPLSLIPHRLWQCLTMPCNPISWPMWHDVHTRPFAFDLVHATAFPYAWPIVCGLQLARRLNVPFFLTPFLHLGDPDDPGDRTRRAYSSPALMSLIQAADRVFVQTQGERQALLERGIDPGKLVLQGLGVDGRECTGGDRERTRQSWNIPAGETAIGHLANNSMEKGTVDLLQAAALLWQRGHVFRVVLAGPEMPNFQSFWKRFPHQDRVLRLGRVSADEKRDFFAAVDMFALPSRSDSFGLVLLEAWANGLPNIAYRAGGIADVIRHGKDGLLAPCGNVPALAEALDRLISNPGLSNLLGEAGQLRTATEFVWADKLNLVQSCYQEISRISLAACGRV